LSHPRPQDIFNLLPNMNVSALSTSLAVKGNDMMAVIYLSSLIRRCLAACGWLVGGWVGGDGWPRHCLMHRESG
jgi:hypothetical protein